MALVTSYSTDPTPVRRGREGSGEGATDGHGMGTLTIMVTTVRKQLLSPVLYEDCDVGLRPHTRSLCFETTRSFIMCCQQYIKAERRLTLGLMLHR